MSHISELAGGAEKSMLDVLDKWQADHAASPEFIIKAPAGSLKDALNGRGWKYHALEYTFWSETRPPVETEDKYRRVLKNTRAITEIEKIIQSSRPDIVVTNSVVCPWAAIAAYYQKIPHVWFVREYGDLDHGRIFDMGRTKTLSDVGNLSSLVVANSKTLAKHLSQYINKDKLFTLYNPFNIEKLNQNAKQKVQNPFKSQDCLRLVMTGSLAPSKGQLEAVEAVDRLSREGYGVELCLVGGNGPREYRQKIDKFIAQNGLEGKVHKVGHQPNPMAFAALADIGVMASRKEAFGRVTFEYMAAGKPVIGTNSGATPELINDGKNGYLYKSGDSNELAGKIKKYATDRRLLIRHGKNSKKKALEIVNSEHNAENLYQKIANLPSKADTAAINFTRQWLEYPQLANDYIIETGKISVKKLLVKRLRGRLGNIYRKSRRLARRILEG